MLLEIVLSIRIFRFWFYRVQFDFEDVHRLNDGQVKHSPEFYYAGSLWKVFKSLANCFLLCLFFYVSFHFHLPIF